jgi:ribosomal protein S18 acetylase RimI-like enzyme
MQNLIDDISSDTLLNALVSNMAAFWSAYGRGNGCTLHATSNVVWFYTGIQVALFNAVVFAKMKHEDVEATIASLQAKIDEHGVPALWWLGPQSTPENLGALLEQYGLQSAGETPGMAADLAALNSMPKNIQNFTMKKVSSVEMQALWGQIAALGTGFSETATTQMAQLEASLTDPQYKAQHRYIGFLDDTPVATSAMVLDSGVAGIYAVATIPQARRKGIGEFMTVMPLLEAQQFGYRVGILQASSMGYPIYKRIGFKDVCKFNIYMQSKKVS